MYPALLELKAARGRFFAMGCVVALVAALVGIVSGFTTGLGDDTVSALRRLDADHLAFSSDARSDQFARSIVATDTVAAWASRPGVKAATPLGVTITRGTTDRGVDVDMAAFGIVPGSFLDPGAGFGSRPDGIVVSRQLADKGVHVGDTVAIDRLGIRLPVVGVTGRSSYGHVAVAYLPIATWQRVRFTVPGATDATVPDQVTAVALRTGAGADLTAGDAALGTRTTTVTGSFAAAPGYTGERLTMNSIQVFLYLIAPLVVGAFFAVWTVQRRPSLALQRALGAPRRRLLAHTLTQAAVVVVGGAFVGALIATGVGVLLGDKVPYSLPPTSLASTMALVALTGLAGTVLSLRKVATTDPMTMLGAAR